MVTEDIVLEKLVNLNVKKANGWDNTTQTITNSSFPNNLKIVEITPLFKKGNSLESKNYRHISVLTCISKVFESISTDQLGVFLNIFFFKIPVWIS